MKKSEFKKYSLSRNAILAMNKMDARNYSMASKIYCDIAFGYYDFSQLSLNLPLKSKTPVEHIDSYKFLNSVLGLSSSIYEAYKFFVTVEDLHEFLSDKKINLSNDKNYPFKSVRDMIGNHYAPEIIYQDLFHEIFRHYHVLAGKNLRYYLGVNSYKSAFPETTNINWTVMYIVDHENTWKTNYHKNKSEYICSKLREIMDDDSTHFQDWLNKYLDAIFKSKKIIEECCQRLLSTIYHKNKGK